MSFKKLITVTAALATALALGGCGAPDDALEGGAQPIENGELVATPDSVDLGRVATGSVARIDVQLTNRGGNTVDVTRVPVAGTAYNAR